MHDKVGIELSIVIVTWNSEQEISGCINSIIENTASINFEIIVIDNDSNDKTAEVLKSFDKIKSCDLKLIFNSNNFGYTKACNQGIEIAMGENIFLLNPDTQFTLNCAELLMKKLNEDAGTGGIAPQLLNEDLTIQKSCRTFPRYFDIFCEMTLLSRIFPDSELLSNWKMNYFSHNEERSVEQPMAAALMIKKKVLDEVKNFDDRYSMFFNDVDLCKKIRDKGYTILFFPEARIIHQKGVSIYKDRVRMIKVWNDDCLKYFKKYHYNIIFYNLLALSLKVTGFFRILFYRITK
ncbi:MAG TPA: glycosyltransferase family 2 protein [Ignavibacteria bacterium]|nr:glycosyltransferase family 2 protein [Ignavibacteria bacterium]